VLLVATSVMFTDDQIMFMMKKRIFTLWYGMVDKQHVAPRKHYGLNQLQLGVVQFTSQLMQIPSA